MHQNHYNDINKNKIILTPKIGEVHNSKDYHPKKKIQVFKLDSYSFS